MMVQAVLNPSRTAVKIFTIRCNIKQLCFQTGLRTATISVNSIKRLSLLMHTECLLWGRNSIRQVSGLLYAFCYHETRLLRKTDRTVSLLQECAV
jgi:hypothetical protein